MKRYLFDTLGLKPKLPLLLVLMSLTLASLLAACGTQPAELSIKEELAQYEAMTYREFQELSDAEAEHLHAQFFMAPLPDTELQAVFQADQYDEENMVFLLGEGSVLHRLEGNLGLMLTGFTAEMPIEDFAEALSNGDYPHTIEEGGGTAYYVADRYLSAQLGDDVTLQIALDASETIGPDSYAWLLWENAAEEGENAMAVETPSAS